MTVSSQIPYNAYTYAGSPTFVYGFRLILATDLQVSVNSTIQPAANYSISGIGSQSGGSILYTGTLNTGDLVELQRVTVLQRVTDYQDEGDFLAATVNADYDRLWMALQEQQRNQAQSIRVPEATGVPILPAAAARANMLQAYDSSGNPTVFVPVSGSAADVLVQLADTTSASKGAGASGFSYLLNYASRTIGWALKQSAVNIAWFSSSVVGGDWTPAWQAAHNWAEALTSGGYVVCPPGFVGQFKTAKVWNPNKVGFDAQGAQLDYSAFSGGSYVVTNRQTSTDPNFRGCLNRAHPWRNFNAIGPSGTVTFMKIADTNPLGSSPNLNYVINGVTVMNGSCTNFYRDFEIGDGAFHLNFISVDFNITGGSGYDTCIYLPAAFNSGENIHFVGCRFGKSSGSGIRVINTNSSVILRGCSANYMPNFIDCQGGSVDWDGYIEASNDTDYWVKVTGQNSIVRIAGEVVMTGNKSVKEIFYSDASCTNGGLDVDIAREFAPFTYPLKLIGGTGRAKYRERASGMSSVHPAIGAGTNLLCNGDFENATFGLDDWTITGTVAISTTYARSGTHSAKLTGAIGVTASMTRIVPCGAAQSVAGEVYHRADNLTGSGGAYVINVAYLNAAGNPIAASATPGVTTNVGAFTQTLFSAQTPAPVGTVSARISISLFGVTSVAGGTPAVYVDDGQLTIA